ncbi:MAG: glutamine synthetase [candidate division Zixibacteria bacterium]|nr:glutamine synthetase [candidate division Zixibacteria bacterium]
MSFSDSNTSIRIIDGVNKEASSKYDYSKEDILRLITDNDIKYIRLWFTDILGRLKGMSITRSEIEQVLEEGQGFDGSSIEGFVRIEESDLMARPDLNTFRIFPWAVGGEKVGLLFCDIETPDGRPYEGDPRWVMKRVTNKLAEKGLASYMGPELEYFYFENSKEPRIIDNGGYFDYATVDKATRLRKKTANALEALGIPVECSHHEVAPSQQEIDLKYQQALRMADYAMIYRLVVKELAVQEGVYASFMPKPIYGENGSGMHVHQSLFSGDTNVFFASDDSYHLSDTARSYIAGILKYVPEFLLITNQWVNSYKRLVGGYEAPVYISWGRRNRSSLVRVPMYRVGKEKATRIELRCPDPACNPYLAFAAMISAGMAGIEEGLQLPEPIENNIFDMPEQERISRGIKMLPNSLDNAIKKFAKSELMRDVLGDHIFNTLIANKWVEWDRYRTQVTGYEVDTYLPWL